MTSRGCAPSARSPLRPEWRSRRGEHPRRGRSGPHAAPALALAALWPYRRSRPVYRQLRNTMIATWLIAVPIFAAFPVAPRLAGMGLARAEGRVARRGDEKRRPAGVEWPVAAKRVVGRRLSVSGLVVFEAGDDRQRSAAAPAHHDGG